MDKRTLLLFLSLMLSFMVINTYFTYQGEQDKKEWYDQQKKIKEKRKDALTEQIKKETLPLSSFPLVKVFSDHENKDLITTGYLSKESLLLLPWSPAAEEKIYVENKQAPFMLTAEQKGEGSPILYTSGDNGKLSVRTLPPFGSYTLQLLFISPSDPTPVKNYLALYQNGQVTLPITQLANDFPDEFKKDLPSGYAIAVVKMDDQYYPAGIFHYESKTLTPLTDFDDLKSHLVQQSSVTPSTQTKQEEKHYVLENEEIQLVFSNVGGAISEINLPFSTKENDESVVKKIEFDREMVENHPQNAYFPAHSYYTSGKDGPVLHRKGELGGYYPLLRRDLMQAPPLQSKKISPAYYATNIVSKYPELAELVYNVKEFSDKKVVFEAKQPHRRITKTYELLNEEEAPYCFDLTIQIEGDSRGLLLTSGVPDVEWISGNPAPAMKYRVVKAGNSATVKDSSLPDPVIEDSTLVNWLCNSNGFFGVIADPLNFDEEGFKLEKVSGQKVPSRLVLIDQEYDRFKPESMPGYISYLPLSEKGGTMKYRIFSGPFATDILRTVDNTFTDPETGYTPDYIACQTFHGYFTFITKPISNFLLLFMRGFYQLTGSWGFSIILLTIVLRLMLYPFNSWSMKSMQKMKEINPQVQKIQEKYKKDPKKLQLETARLYREAGVNPISGCLPMLLQFPFLIGMFDLLKSTFELRGATFIPGWIDNLAAPDVVFQWHYPIFFIGTEFHALPILLGATMFFQQKLSSTAPSDPSQMTDQQRQQQSMMSIMSIVFTVMFYHFPSGLNIYWLSSMLVGIVQQWLMNKKSANGEALKVVKAEAPAKKRKKRS